jgi:hypothetical protein
MGRCPYEVAGMSQCTIHERLRMSAEHPARSTLTVNRSFIRDFLAAESPCFALGLVEERRRLGGFLALQPPQAIPPAITDIGFRFGHALLGNADFVVVQFVFVFYGFEMYNVLVNPNNLLVQTVVTTMVQNEDYFFFAFDARGSVTAFRSDIGHEDLAGLTTNLPRIQQARTTEAQYRRAVTRFAQHPDPADALLPWVCRDHAAYLDLTTDRLDMTPA